MVVFGWNCLFWVKPIHLGRNWSFLVDFENFGSKMFISGLNWSFESILVIRVDIDRKWSFLVIIDCFWSKFVILDRNWPFGLQMDHFGSCSVRNNKISKRMLVDVKKKKWWKWSQRWNQIVRAKWLFRNN